MKRPKLTTFILTIAATVSLAAAIYAAPLGTAFTYQGQLTYLGSPANGSYDLKFTLYDAAGSGSPVAGPLTNSATDVTNGLFTVTLDFGSGIFTGNARWVEIEVKTNNMAGPYTLLSPRQELTPTPYTIHAVAAGSIVDNSVTSAKIVDNTITAADIAADAVGTSEIVDDSVSSSDLASDGSSLAKVSASAMTASGSRIGIGTATPGSKLHLFDSGNDGDLTIEDNTPIVRLNRTDTSGNCGISFLDNGAYAGWLMVRGTDKALVMSAGTSSAAQNNLVLTTSSRMGIGTSAPASKLHLFDSGNDGDLTIEDNTPIVRLNRTDTSGNCGISFLDNGAYAGWLMVRGTDKALVMSAGTSSVVQNNLVLTTSGDVGMGTNAPQAQLDVVQPSGGDLAFRAYNAGSGNYANVGGNWYGVYGHGSTYDFYAASGPGGYGSASSQRWKTNVQPIAEPLAKLAQLRGVSFDWDTSHGGGHDIGMIAEEVGEVLPEIVAYETNGVDALGMDYSRLSPLLVEAIKELEQRVTEKDAKIAGLEKRMENLERLLVQQNGDGQ